MEINKTPLYQKHVDLKATLTDFAGYSMPLYYKGIKDEHLSVRNSVGMFDVSHMGEILITGKDAYDFANYIFTAKIVNSDKMIYTLLCNQEGFILDDLMIYPLDDTNILVISNASNTTKDFDWITKNKSTFDVKIENNSDNYAQIAIQGPKSYEVLSKLIDNLPSKSQTFVYTDYNRNKILVSRSGYTGEDGFEIYIDPTNSKLLWDELLNLNVAPCGLGCRDTLRFEAAMPLYGNEMSDSIDPFEAGLSFACDLTKNSLSTEGLLKRKNNQKRKLVGIELIDKNIARHGYEVLLNDQIIGHITTGYLSITLNKSIALALIDIEHSLIGLNVDILIRNKLVKAVIRNKKFINKNNNI